MTAADRERAAALAALVNGNPVDEGGGSAPTPPPTRTGVEKFAGGNVPRLLVRTASTLGHFADGQYHRAEAVPGDVVLLSPAQANRLDELGVTAPVDDTPPQSSTGPTDADLAAMGAADTVAYVTQNPDQAPRVRALELGKGKTKQRSSVLDATDPDLLEDDTD